MYNIFKQAPAQHMIGQGCPYCAKNIKYSFDDFEKKGSVIHNNKFSYHQDYKKSTIRVKITCPYHGNFYQTPSSHLSGSGCKKCDVQNRTKSIKEFEYIANIIHNNKYVYHNDYINNHTKVKITCPEHGDFYQIPNNHTNCKHGCPRCANYRTENEIFDLITEISGHMFEKVRLPELNGLELDMYNNFKKIAIEYQGEGHYYRYMTGKWIFKEEIIKKVWREI
jgi:hypothetical protein